MNMHRRNNMMCDMGMAALFMPVIWCAANMLAFGKS